MTVISDDNPTPLLEIMKRFEERLAKHASNPQVKLGVLQIEISGMPGQLSKIYGKDHPTLALFPKIVPGSIDPGRAHEIAVARFAQVQSIIRNLENLLRPRQQRGDRVFLGHGRSPLWRELKDFIQDRLHLPWDEFNRDPVVGLATVERLKDMLDTAGFAFLIMTAEDEMAEGMTQARPNVIHEVGLFQGRLGMRRAIVMLEDGCAEFSNIVGLSQIRFARNRIDTAFEEVRKVLEREGMIHRA